MAAASNEIPTWKAEHECTPEPADGPSDWQELSIVVPGTWSGAPIALTKRILVASHDPLAQRALAELVGSLPDTRVLREPDPDAALAGNPLPVDAIVWEAEWTSVDLRRLLDVHRLGARVVALAANTEQARRVRAAGATAVLPRGVDAPALEAALAAVLEGLTVSDPTLEAPSIDRLDLDRGGENLTPRELEVLSLIAEGLSNKAIASRLTIRESTVKDHVNSMLEKLGAQSRTEAVTLALRRGLIAI
jgi:DNA-binding NarL/FixJ family response regulator